LDILVAPSAPFDSKTGSAAMAGTMSHFSDYPTLQDIAGVLSGAWSGITVPSHAPNDPNFRQKLLI
jgi:hypothetical protein